MIENVMTTLCYVKKDGRTLMLHRVKKDQDIHKGKWNGLGGKFLPGESPEECVIREVHEESGLNIENPTLKGFITFPNFKEGQDWQMFVYTAETFTGTLNESCDEGELHWIKDEEIKNLNLWEGDPIFLEWLEQDHFFTGKFVYKNKRLESHSVIFHKK